ncbi:hypothetical protein Tco_1550582 [Tanacetum coccineum]
MVEYSQKWHNGISRGRSTKTSNRLAAIQAQLNNLGREIKKVNEKVYVAQVGCEQCKGPYYTKDCPLKEEGKTLEEAYYTQFGGPFLGGGYGATTPSESVKRHEENSNLIKEIRATTDAAIRNQGASIKTLEIQIGQMSKLIHTRYAVLDHPNTPYPLDRIVHCCASQDKRRFLFQVVWIIITVKMKRGTLDQNSRKLTEAYGASHIKDTIHQKEKDPRSFTLPCFINNTCFDNSLVELGASISVMPLSTYINLGLGELAHTRLTVELADRMVKYPKGIAENVLVGIGKFTFPVDFIILDMPEDIKVPLILGRPFLSTARAKIDVCKRKITLRVGEERIIFKSVKPASSS